MFTPWGNADSDEIIQRGIHIVSTPGHGGIMISEGLAKKILTPAAVKRGMKYGNYLCYEEDCAYAIPVFELLELFPNYYSADMLIESLSMWNADYLLEVGIEPKEPQYSYYKDMKLSDKMRENHDPDLIICAKGDWYTKIPGVCEVITADDKKHLVTSESYHSRGAGINLLSNCTLYKQG